MKKRTLLYFFLLIVLIALSFIYDNQIIIFFSSLRNTFLNSFFAGFTFESQLLMFLFLTVLFLWKEHKRRWIIPLWLSLAFSELISNAIKFIVQRPRPFEAGVVSAVEFVRSLIHGSINVFSFPSAHAMAAFSVLPVLDKEFPKFKYVWIIFACLVALSRVYFGVHYMSDVIAGAAIGYAIGLFFVFIEEKYAVGKRILEKLKTKK